MPGLSLFQLFSQEALKLLAGIFLSFIFAYLITDAFMTRKTVKGTVDYPLVGSPVSFMPLLVHNLQYLLLAGNIVQDGYSKFQNKAFQLLRHEGRVVVLPHTLLNELAALPETIASLQPVLSIDLSGYDTGLDWAIKTKLNNITIQRRLTPRLPYLIPQMEETTRTNLDALFPKLDEWTEIQPFHLLERISTGLVANAIVGPSLRDDPAWVDISLKYTKNAAGSELNDQLVAEIAATMKEGWKDMPYDRLYRLDSAMSESQRMSPPSLLGMKRLFKFPYTFQDGTHVTAGTYTCIATSVIENNSANTPNPEIFNGPRRFHTLESKRSVSQFNETMAKEFSFSTPTPTALILIAWLASNSFHAGLTAARHWKQAVHVTRTITVYGIVFRIGWKEDSGVYGIDIDFEVRPFHRRRDNGISLDICDPQEHLTYTVVAMWAEDDIDIEWGDINRTIVHALLIEPTGHIADQYRRIGIASIHFDKDEHQIEDLGVDKRIVLV
ncbi:hypothetical protein F4801DRAFT_583704 [Xylaria longipes]|nr:hypothetical protein F4801DRAFT_583704 [Xylaria longipes]